MVKIGAKYMGKDSLIIFVSGYLCSGKGLYIKRNFKSYIRIGVSDIIKHIIGESTRKELQDTAHLDKQIAQRIGEIILATPDQKYVVDGIRQLTIYKALRSILINNCKRWNNVWLEVPYDECKRRFLAKNDGKENISFEQAFERDKDLGLLDLESYWKTQTHCQIIKNY